MDKSDRGDFMNKKVLVDLIKEYGDIRMFQMQNNELKIYGERDWDEFYECQEQLSLEEEKVVFKLKKYFGIELYEEETL